MSKSARLGVSVIMHVDSKLARVCESFLCVSMWRWRGSKRV